jgi:hypothetical protein
MQDLTHPSTSWLDPTAGFADGPDISPAVLYIRSRVWMRTFRITGTDAKLLFVNGHLLYMAYIKQKEV